MAIAANNPANSASMGMSGSPNVWNQLGLAGQNQQELSDEEEAKRKKKIMSAGQSNDFQSAMTAMFGQRLNSAA